VLSDHPGVGEVAVVGVPDPVLGEIGLAFVVPADASGAPDPDDLRRWVGTHLADYKVPDRVFVLDAMPLTSVGKIDRRSLAAGFADG
jgi:acyl-CoA synthetase (AMP-forming)/AMP-acid ligase II